MRNSGRSNIVGVEDLLHLFPRSSFSAIYTVGSKVTTLNYIASLRHRIRVHLDVIELLLD